MNQGVDSIGKMMHAGTITPAMHDAARTFQTDFALAGLDPLRARPMMLPCGARCAPEMTERQIDARWRVHEALDALGGLNGPAGSAAWHILGCGCSVREWALHRGWSGQPLRQEQAAGILIAALGVLVCRTRQSPRSGVPEPIGGGAAR